MLSFALATTMRKLILRALLVAAAFALCLVARPARAEIQQVQIFKGNTSSATTSVSATPGTATTAGNLLVATIFMNGVPATLTSPAGWASVTSGTTTGV